MAFIKTDNPLDISGGHCHGSTAPLPSQNTVRINGNGVMVFGLSVYSVAECGQSPHARLCFGNPTHPNIRINQSPVFTSDDLIQCLEPAGVGIFPVFAN
jgi:hypothetical protein